MRFTSVFKNFIAHMYYTSLSPNKEEKLPIAKDDSYRKGFNIEVMVTHRCNLSCKYCCAYPPCKEEPNLDQMKIILKKIYEEINPDVIFLGGGEPLLRRDLFDIMEIIREYGPGVDLFSNGTLITNDVAKKLKEYQNKHELNFSVSLDSYLPEINDKTRGRYHEVIKGIQKLKKYDVDFAIAIVLSKQNANTILDTLEYFRKHFSKKIHIINLRPSGRALENFDELFLSPQEVSSIWKNIFNYLRQVNYDITLYHPFDEYGIEKCSAGKRRCTILPNGDIIPCDMATTFVIGNIYRNSLREVLSSKAIQELLKLNCEERLCLRNLRKLGYSWPFEHKPVKLT